MQLRVARLCLDCEELYVGSACPVCASEHSVFLSSWLPVEERRKWRRPSTKANREKRGLFQAIKAAFSRWFGDKAAAEAPRTLRTRASDRVPDLNFDPPSKDSKPQASSSQEPSRVSPHRR